MSAWRVIAMVLASMPIEALAETVTLAIVVGNNAAIERSGAASEPLRYADDDAVRYFELFSRFSDDVVLLSTLDQETQQRYPGVVHKARPPSVDALEHAVLELGARSNAARARGAEVVFYFIYSGHGAANAAGAYFLGLSPGELTRQALYSRVIDRIAASRHHLIIDACHADAIVSGRGMFERERKGEMAAVTAEEAFSLSSRGLRQRYPNVGSVVASASDEETHEWSRLRSGVFTHEVLSALSGAADINGDGRVEYSELQAFVSSANRAIDDRRAMPQMLARAPADDLRASIVDLSLARRGAHLLGRVPAWGHFYVESERGERILDAHVADGSFLHVLVPEKTLLFVRRDGLEAAFEAKDGERIDLERLRFSPARESARGSIDVSYRRFLFLLPYDASFYRGFVSGQSLVSVDFPAALAPLALKPVQAASVWVRPEPVSRPAKNVSSARRGSALALWIVSAAATAGAGLAFSAMLQAERDFDATSLQAQAWGAADRYDLFRGLGAGSVALAASAAAIGFGLWPWP